MTQITIHGIMALFFSIIDYSVFGQQQSCRYNLNATPTRQTLNIIKGVRSAEVIFPVDCSWVLTSVSGSCIEFDLLLTANASTPVITVQGAGSIYQAFQPSLNEVGHRFQMRSNVVVVILSITSSPSARRQTVVGYRTIFTNYCYPPRTTIAASSSNVSTRSTKESPVLTSLSTQRIITTSTHSISSTALTEGAIIERAQTSSSKQSARIFHIFLTRNRRSGTLQHTTPSKEENPAIIIFICIIEGIAAVVVIICFMRHRCFKKDMFSRLTAFVQSGLNFKLVSTCNGQNPARYGDSEHSNDETAPERADEASAVITSQATPYLSPANQTAFSHYYSQVPPNQNLVNPNVSDTTTYSHVAPDVPPSNPNVASSHYYSQIISSPTPASPNASDTSYYSQVAPDVPPSNPNVASSHYYSQIISSPTPTSPNASDTSYYSQVAPDVTPSNPHVQDPHSYSQVPPIASPNNPNDLVGYLTPLQKCVPLPELDGYVQLQQTTEVNITAVFAQRSNGTIDNVAASNNTRHDYVPMN